VRTVHESKADGLPLLAAGVAFYALLALAPALTALAGLYGLAADPADAARHVSELLTTAPREVRDLVEEQLVSAAEQSQETAVAMVLVGTALALWAASSGLQHLISAINVAYDEEETRGFVRRRGLALALSVAAVLFMAVAVGVIALVPAALADTALGSSARLVIGILRWPALAAALAVGLAVVYRLAPDRDDARWSWTAPGTLAATLLWVIGSAAFSLYVSSVGRYEETYGALGGVVVVMLWLFLTSFCVLLGAELNAESERQTVEDTTAGGERPLGSRDARAADTVGPSADAVAAGVPASADVAHRRRSGHAHDGQGDRGWH
jgi:membrane protein